MTGKDNSSGEKPDQAAVVRLDRVRDKLQRKRQDDQAAALAAQFHEAMGWKGTAVKPGKKSKRKKKRTP